MAVVDAALRRKFRRTVEERLEVATVQNARMILSWELSPTFSHLALTCHGDVFEPRVVEHLATSLTRIIGVGKRMGLVDRGLSKLTIECSGYDGAAPPALWHYDVG